MRHDTVTKPPSELLYLDALYVGRRFRSGTHALDERQILAFANEFDPQPFHTDREAAKATLFRGLAASGWHTAAITMRLQVNGGLPIAGGIVGLGGEVTWPTATRPGDVLHVESEIPEVVPSRSRPDRGTVTEQLDRRRLHHLTALVASFAACATVRSDPPGFGPRMPWVQEGWTFSSASLELGAKTGPSETVSRPREILRQMAVRS